ncbi:MAG: 16S rRNA processing protein RimM [Myxococcales bacterium]|nr:16S rRNA processing protein RimM [Myxococcales bacterium]HRC58545.1 ribosome maturation factor RimM [Kofleriaceae bacterium]
MRGRDRIEIGGVARAHGIAGEIVVVTHDPDSMVLEDIAALCIAGTWHNVQRSRGTQRGWLILLEGISTRNQAEGFRGAVVEVPREQVPLEPGEFLLDDLIGCQVELADGRPWGTVAAIEPDYQDRLVIHHDGKERLLPVVPECIVSVDVEAGKIVVDPPEGIPEIPIPTPRR